MKRRGHVEYLPSTRPGEMPLGMWVWDDPPPRVDLAEVARQFLLDGFRVWK
jgi:hypothetical protein